MKSKFQCHQKSQAIHHPSMDRPGRDPAKISWLPKNTLKIFLGSV